MASNSAVVCAVAVNVGGRVHLLNLSATAIGQSVTDPATANLKTGEQIYKAACISCHGVDGTGAPAETPRLQGSRHLSRLHSLRPNHARTQYRVGSRNHLRRPVPRFFANHAVVRAGAYAGPDPRGRALLRSFCTNPHWPRGELNLPRALVTEKAFPESEEVISTAVNAQGAPGVETHYIHEQRFGVKNQIEIDVPINFSDQDHVWYGGVGDVTFGYKREIYSSLKKGNIFSLFGGVVAPTGSTDHGFGSGTTTFETFAAYDQALPQQHLRPDTARRRVARRYQKAPQAMFWNTAVGQMFAPDHGLGRLWSPMVEVIMNRDFETGAKTNWDIVPQMQVTISRRQHVRGNLGVRVPVNNTAGRPVQLMFYLLWDWADGKLTEGW